MFLQKMRQLFNMKYISILATFTVPSNLSPLGKYWSVGEYLLISHLWVNIGVGGYTAQTLLNNVPFNLSPLGKY